MASEHLIAAFERQGDTCAMLGSPFMGRLLRLIPGALPHDHQLTARLLAWPPERLSARADSVPLRLAGALHRLVLTGQDRGLATVYPPNTASDSALAAELRRVFDSHGETLTQGLASPPQTNEVRRAAALIAAGHWLTALWGRPMISSEIGASAGLNLNWDVFQMKAAGRQLGVIGSPVMLTPEWRGAPPLVCPPYTEEAVGVDLAPIDVGKAEDVLRLKSYIWPDQADRMALTDAAITLFQKPDTGGRLGRGDALDWLPGRLLGRRGYGHFLYSTIAWQYLPKVARDRGAALIAASGAKATPEEPLAWFRMEEDGQSPGAGLQISLWPGGRHLTLGRADFHGRWIDWQAPPPSEFSPGAAARA